MLSIFPLTLDALQGERHFIDISFSDAKSDFHFLQIIYHNFMNNGSSPRSMHPGRLIAFWH